MNNPASQIPAPKATSEQARKRQSRKDEVSNV